MPRKSLWWALKSLGVEECTVCHPGHLLQYLELCVCWWSMVSTVRSLACYLVCIRAPIGLHPGAGVTFVWVLHWCAMGVFLPCCLMLIIDVDTWRRSSWSQVIIIISIFRLWCCPCPIQFPHHLSRPLQRTNSRTKLLTILTCTRHCGTCPGWHAQPIRPHPGSSRPTTGPFLAHDRKLSQGQQRQNRAICLQWRCISPAAGKQWRWH